MSKVWIEYFSFQTQSVSLTVTEALIEQAMDQNEPYSTAMGVGMKLG